MLAKNFTKKNKLEAVIISFIHVAFITSLTIVEVVEAGKKAAGTVEYNGEYYHYEVTCKDKAVDYYQTLVICKDDHPDDPLDWVRASVPSKDANDLLASLTDEGIWIGGLRKAISDSEPDNLKWVWPGHKQTTRVETFAYTNVTQSGSVVGECAEGKFCNFVDGALTTLTVKCGNDRPETKALILLSKADATEKGRQWAAVPGDMCRNVVPTAKCYSCQKVDDEPGPSPLWTSTTSNPTTAPAPTPGSTTSNPTTAPAPTPGSTTTTTMMTQTEMPSYTSPQSNISTTIEPVKPKTDDSDKGKGETTVIIVVCIVGAIILIGLILLSVYLFKRVANARRKATFEV